MFNQFYEDLLTPEVYKYVRFIDILIRKSHSFLLTNRLLAEQFGPVNSIAKFNGFPAPCHQYLSINLNSLDYIPIPSPFLWSFLAPLNNLVTKKIMIKENRYNPYLPTPH